MIRCKKSEGHTLRITFGIMALSVFLLIGSASADKIAFVSDRSGTNNIWSINSDGTGLKQLTFDTIGLDFQPDWSPDGSKIAYNKYNPAQGASDRIWKMNADGSGSLQLISDEGGSPTWSPDGTKIAFRSERTNYNGWFYEYVMNADGTNQNLIGSEGTECDQSWSPDSKKIAYAMGYAGNIYVANFDGTQKSQIASSKLLCAGLSWSPDGSKIAYSSGETGYRHIYIINPDGTGKTQLTTGSYQDNFRPDDSSSVPNKLWSPDGQKIIFLSNRNGNWDIYSINRDGTGLAQLTNDASKKFSAQWSPDGSKIAYISDKSGKNSIWIMNSDGSNQVQVTDNVGNALSLVWSPIGIPAPSPTPTVTPSPLPDLSITSIEPVQVVYNPDINGDGRMDFVQGKATAVKVSIEGFEGLSDATMIDVNLNYEGTTYTLSKTVANLKKDKTVIFYLTPRLTGDQVLKAEVDPFNKIPESDKTNNQATKTITVKEVRTIRYAYVKVDYLDSVPNYTNTVTDSGNLLQSVYPIDPAKFENKAVAWQFIPAPAGYLQNDSGAKFDALWIWIDGKLTTNAERFIGVVPEKWFSYHKLDATGINFHIEPSWAFPMVNEVVFITDNHPFDAAHELGHSYGFNLQQEDYQLNPDNTCCLSDGTPTNGFWVEGKREVNAISYMGDDPYPSPYPDPNNPNSIMPRWSTPDNFEKLFQQFRTNQNDPEVLLITGYFHADGTATLNSIYRSQTGIVSQITAGDSAIQLLDTNGNIVASLPFKIDFHIALGSSQTTDTVPFAFSVPFPSNATQIQVIQNGKTLIQVNIGSRLLHDAVLSIPDNGFVSNPSQRRDALLNKIDALDKQLSQGDMQGAKEKLQNDIRKHISDWLVDNYSTQTPSQYTKTELLNLTDELLQRLSNQ